MSMQVFISYKSEEVMYAREVKEQLHKEGFTGWYDDVLRAGDEWQQVIDNAIRDSLAVIVIVTPLSLTSHYVTYEWSFAMGLGKRVIPIIYEKLPTSKIHSKIDPNVRHLIDFTDSKNWDELYTSLREIHDAEVIPQSIAEAGSILQSLKFQELWSQSITLLENSSHPSCQNILLGIVEGHIDQTSIMAALAYSRINQFSTDRAIGGLKRAIEKPEFQQEKDLGIAASEALAKIGTLEAINLLISKYPTFKETALGHNILFNLGFSTKDEQTSEQAKNFLRKELSALNDSRRAHVYHLINTINSLGELRDTEALADINQLRKEQEGSHQNDIRKEAIKAWVLISGNNVLEEVKKEIIKSLDATSNLELPTVYIRAVARLKTPEALNMITEIAGTHGGILSDVVNRNLNLLDTLARERPYIFW